jgi:uncharacterized membrane protein
MGALNRWFLRRTRSGFRAVADKATLAEAFAHHESNVDLLGLHLGEEGFQIGDTEGNMLVAVGFQIAGRMAAFLGQGVAPSTSKISKRSGPFLTMAVWLRAASM